MRPQSAFRNPRVALLIPQYVVRLVWDTRQFDRSRPFRLRVGVGDGPRVWNGRESNKG